MSQLWVPDPPSIQEVTQKSPYNRISKLPSGEWKAKSIQKSSYAEQKTTQNDTVKKALPFDQRP